MIEIKGKGTGRNHFPDHTPTRMFIYPAWEGKVAQGVTARISIDVLICP